jgi:hypothetical protein
MPRTKRILWPSARSLLRPMSGLGAHIPHPEIDLFQRTTPRPFSTYRNILELGGGALGLTDLPRQLGASGSPTMRE